MTPQAQQIAIAVACKVIRPWTFGSFQTPNGCLLASLPDYLNDLNAMHEVEKLMTATQLKVYRNTLAMMNGGIFMEDGGSFVNLGFAVSATATQRAEAFLRTLNLWKD